MSFIVVTTPDFDQDVKQLKKRYRRIDEDLRNLLQEMENLEYRGNFIPGYGQAVYKVRLANRSARRGKRGGFPAIYLRQDDGTFVSLHIYSKSDKNNVSASGSGEGSVTSTSSRDPAFARPA